MLTVGVALELGDLEGDGIPKAELERLLSRAETDALRLLDDFEAVRLRLKVGIEHEYDAMRRGESELLRLLVVLGDARAIDGRRGKCR